MAAVAAAAAVAGPLPARVARQLMPAHLLLLPPLQTANKDGGRQVVQALSELLLREREDDWLLAITEGAPATCFFVCIGLSACLVPAACCRQNAAGASAVLNPLPASSPGRLQSWWARAPTSPATQPPTTCWRAAWRCRCGARPSCSASGRRWRHGGWTWLP